MMMSNGCLLVRSWILVLVVVGSGNKGRREMVLGRERVRDRAEKKKEENKKIGKISNEQK